MNEIDIEQLRRDLKEELTAIMFCVSPAALVELSEIENASDEKLIEIARNHKINLEKYKI